MPHQPANSPLGAFLAALREEKIRCILIGNMAAIHYLWRASSPANVRRAETKFWLLCLSWNGLSDWLAD
jgi:hypothetical protein